MFWYVGSKKLTDLENKIFVFLVRKWIRRSFHLNKQKYVKCHIIIHQIVSSTKISFFYYSTTTYEELFLFFCQFKTTYTLCQWFFFWSVDRVLNWNLFIILSMLTFENEIWSYNHCISPRTNCFKWISFSLIFLIVQKYFFLLCTLIHFVCTTFMRFHFDNNIISVIEKSSSISANLILLIILVSCLYNSNARK